jgi:hypothetical protein
MARKHYLRNNFTLAIGLMLSTFLQRRNVTDPETELARVKEIAVEGQLVDQVTADLKKSGFTCVDISDDEAGRRYNVSKVLLCRKEFRERRMVFPTLLSIALLIGEDGSLISFEHHVSRLSL